LLAEHRASIEELEAPQVRAGKRWARSEQVHAIVAALDAAATSIERI
jgi:hypothetical protein